MCRKLLASLYQILNRPADALRQYQELVRVEPRELDHYERIGFLHARLGNLSAAESALEKMLEISPESARGYRALAKLYLNTNQQPARARELAVTAVKLDPVADSYFVLGWASAKNGSRSMALASLKRAMRLEPDNETYRRLYGAIQKMK